MKPLLPPKLDFVFKQLFTRDTDLLTDLINAVLKQPQGRRIRSVRIKNPMLPPEEITQKFIVLDILAVDETERMYDIEMQVRGYPFYSKRTLYYLCKLYAGQLEAGEDYGKLRPVIGIHFLDYEEFPEETDFHFRFELRDIRHPKLRLNDDLCLYFFELPKFDKKKRSGQFRNELSEWLHFFNHAHEEDNTMRTHYKNPVIHKAFTVLEDMSADKKTRYLAEIREKALKNERSMMAAERKEGIKEGRLNTARMLLKMGVLSPEQIEQATGLSADEIRQLQESEND